MIDRKPAVGRCVFGVSRLPSGFTGRYGRITKIAGKRIHFDCVSPDGTIKPTFLLSRSVAAVCDSDTEVQIINSFNLAAINEAVDLRQRHWNAWRELIGVPRELA